MSVTFVCDEANALGKMPQIANALTIGRSYGIRMQLYYQDLGQIKKNWPDGTDTTLLANTTSIWFACNDFESAKLVSDRLGEGTIIVTSGGTNVGTNFSQSNGGNNSTGGQSGRSSNWNEAGRKLLKPEEVMTLDERTAITFVPGLPPVATRLVRHYEQDAHAKNRAGAARFTAAGWVLLFVLMAVGGLWYASAANNQPPAGRTQPVQQPSQVKPAEKAKKKEIRWPVVISPKGSRRTR